MRLVAAVFLLAAFAMGSPWLRAQGVPEAAVPKAAVLEAAPPAPPVLASTLLRPGLDGLGPGLDGLRADRWKLPQAARDEVLANVGSMHRDLESTLPALLATADRSPGSVVAELAVSRNVTALYDVLLRILERAKGSAPADQVAGLEQLRGALDSARRAFDENLQTVAGREEALVQQLQVRLATPPAPLPAPPAAAPAKKTKTKPRSN